MPGFTLIELMITLAVAAILMAVALPSFRTFVLNVRRDSLVDSLVSSLHYARNQALNLDEDTSLCAGTNGVSCTAGQWANGWQVIAAPAGSSSVLLTTHNLQPSSDDPQLQALDGTVHFTFNGRGLSPDITSAAKIMTICDSRGSAFARAVEINLAGSIQASSQPGQAPDGTALVCP